MIVYERVPKRYGTMLTFALSAIWHGFYPGYYITFATGALVVSAARVARSRLRHRFQGRAWSRDVYDVLTCFTTRFFMGYATFPFVLLELGGSVRLYLKLYMCLHIVALVTLFGMPFVLRAEKRRAITTRDAVKDPLNVHELNGGGAGEDISGNGGTPPNKSQRLAADGSSSSNSSNDDIESLTNINLVKEKLMSLDGVSEALLDDLRKNLEQLDAKNIEEFIAKTRSGIVELKDDLMKEAQPPEMMLPIGNSCCMDGAAGVSSVLKKEIHHLNVAVQSIPAVFSNSNAK